MNTNGFTSTYWNLEVDTQKPLQMIFYFRKSKG